MRSLSVFLFFSLCIHLSVCAQHPSVNNRFSVDNVKGCAGMTITVDYNVCSTDINNLCSVRITDKATNQIISNNLIVDEGTITFPNDGNYSLKINYSASGIRDSIDIFVTPNTPPVLDVALCSGGQVLAKVTNNSEYPFYIFQFDNVASSDVQLPAATASTTHTFITPPIQHIVSVRGYNGDFNGLPTDDNCTPRDITVNVLPLVAASISKVEVIDLDPGSIKVDFEPRDNVQYKLAAATNNSTSFAPIKTILNPVLPATETVSNIRPDDNYYCFRLDTYNACTNTLAAFSTVVCSVNFDAVAQNNINQLNWTTAPTSGSHLFSSYTILKENVAINLPANQFSFTDNNVICNQDTAYQLIINYPDNAQSISFTKNVTSFSSDQPTTIEDITATVTDAGVELTWIQDPLFTPKAYTLVKNSNGSFSAIGTSATPTFTDTEYNTETPTCYIISYRDVCLNDSDDSEEACPIQLQASLLDKNEIQLNWNAYTGWKDGVQQYTIEKYSAAGTLLDTYTTNTPSYLDAEEDFLNQVYTYIVYANANDGTLPVAASNVITIVKEPNLFYPSAFTPNTDALNDTFTVFGQYLTAIELKIFNRWGELLYTTNALEGDGWNGFYRGSLQPEAAYVFTATLKDQAGRTFERSGSFYLLRKK